MCDDPENCDPERIKYNHKKEVFKIHAIIAVEHPTYTANHCTICVRRLQNCNCVVRPSIMTVELNLIHKSKCATCGKQLDIEGKKTCQESQPCRLVDEKARNTVTKRTRERVIGAMEQQTEQCETPTSERIINALTRNKKRDC